MSNNFLKMILAVAVTIVLFSIVVSFVSWLVKVLLPVAVIVIAAYIVYMVFAKKRY